MKTVGIIGAAGFIGSHVTKKFLAEGFRVKASATTPDNKEKYAHLFALPGAENLELCALDLRNKETIAPFIDGCSLLVHGGTPFQLDVADPQTDLIEPTVEGTRHFLEALTSAKDLERVVFIASVAAWNTSFPLNPAPYGADHIFTENDMPYFNENDHPYAHGKYMADQAVRAFTGEHTKATFEIVSISPVWVIGKPLSARADSTSQGLQYLLKNSIAPNPFVQHLFDIDALFSMVDVRDVAAAVYAAATTPGHHGKNYLVGNDSYAVSDITRMLNGKEPANEAAHYYSHELLSADLNVKLAPAKETLFECAG